MWKLLSLIPSPLVMIYEYRDGTKIGQEMTVFGLFKLTKIA